MGDLYTVKPSERIEESRRIDAWAIERELLRQEIKNKAVWSLGVAFLNISDFMGGGFRSGGFTVIHGDTGTGLTTFVANLAVSLVSAKVHTAVFPLQKSGADFGRKLDAAAKYLLRDVVNIDDYLSVVEGGSPPRGIFPTSLTGYIQKEHRNNGRNVFIVDNINWVSGKDSFNGQTEEAIKAIRSLCDRLPIHVVLIMYSGRPANPEIQKHLPMGEKRKVSGPTILYELVDNILFFGKGKSDGMSRYLQFDQIKSEPEKQLIRFPLKTNITESETGITSPEIWYRDINTVFKH